MSTVVIKIGNFGAITLSDTTIKQTFLQLIFTSKPLNSPAYEVGSTFGYLVGIPSIIVEKTAPEEDQKRICAAVKSIEDQYRKREEHRAELQRLADRCTE